MEEVKLNKDEEKHIRTLSLYLEKFHLATGYQNKEVAELLNMDKSYYNKIKLKKFSPISNSISILKKFASLNSKSLIQFISEIEEINTDDIEYSGKEQEWEVIIKKVFSDLGPIIRKKIIIDKTKKLLQNDKNYIEILQKNFTVLSLIIDISENEKWFNTILDIVLSIHSNLGYELDTEANLLIKKIKEYK